MTSGSVRHVGTISAFFLLALGTRLASAAGPPLDFLQIQPNVISIYTGADTAGNIYLVGVAASASSVKVTPGALQSTTQGDVLYVQKYDPSGTALLYSATICEPYEILPGSSSVGAKVDGAGNVYLATAFRAGTVAGVSTWSGDPAGLVAVLKISPQGNSVLLAAQIAWDLPAAAALDVSSDGTVYVAAVGLEVQLARISAAGEITSEYVINETGPPGRQGYTFQEESPTMLGIAVGSDHTVYVSADPDYVYRVDMDNQQLLFRTLVGGAQVNYDMLEGGSNAEVMSVPSICVDSSGNSYVVGYILYNNTAPFALNPVDFTNVVPGTYHGFIAKMDPNGNVLFADAFSTDHLYQIALDPNGKVWAAGASVTGFTVLALDPTGATLQHYISVPAINSDLGTEGQSYPNLVVSLAVDAKGRAMFAGSTTSLILPDPGPGQEEIPNSFWARVIANPPQADLVVSVNASPPVTSADDTITLTISVTNRGSGPANDVSLKYSEVNISNQLAQNVQALMSCQITGAGSCTTDYNFLRIGWPAILPGDTESVKIKLNWYLGWGWAAPYFGSVTALTTSDDVDQSNANSYISLGYDGSTLLHLTGGGPPNGIVIVNDVQYMINPQGAAPNLLGYPVAANSNATVYFPTPQIQNGSVWIFQGWVDGSTDNPRTFAIGQPGPSGLYEHYLMNLVQAPWINPDSPAVNAASFQGGAVAPGQIITLFGSNLGPPQLQTAQLDSTGRIATNLAGVQVLFNGAPAPIVYASATQTSAIVPYEVSGSSSVAMFVQVGGSSSTPVQLNVTDSAPGLFTANSAGTGPLAAFNQDSSINTVSNPAKPGEAVVFFGTGGGLTNSALDGVIAGSNPPQPVLPVSVTIGGLPATVVYAGGVSGQTAGLLQLNVMVPASAPSGLLPVVLTVGANSSQWGATIAVR